MRNVPRRRRSLEQTARPVSATVGPRDFRPEFVGVDADPFAARNCSYPQSTAHAGFRRKTPMRADNLRYHARECSYRVVRRNRNGGTS
jgi:hypothetical protein